MVWIKNGTPDTLSGTGDVMTVSDMSANKFNQFMYHALQDTSTISMDITFNNNTNSVYSKRWSDNGGTDSTSVSQANASNTGWSGDTFTVQETISISGEEKLNILHTIDRSTAGAGNAPTRREQVTKFVPSPDADITRIDSNNSQAGDYVSSSNLSALGSDGTEELNVQDGAIYYDTDLNKEYVLYNNTWTEV